MPRRTRRIKNYKNRSIKRGGVSEHINADNSKSTVSIIGNAVTGAVSNIAGKAVDAGLNIMGLERINKKDDVKNDNIGNNSNNSGEEHGIISDIKNTADKTGANIIGSVNEVLESDTVQSETQLMAQDVADTTENIVNKFNDAMNDKDVKEAVIKAIDNAGQIGEVAVNAAEKPLGKVIDVAAKKAPEVVGSLGSGVIKAGTDLLGAVPFVGAVIDAGKFANDVANSATKAFEAGKEVVDTTVDAVKVTTESINDELKNLEHNKELSQQISDRTENSIKQFETPNVSNMEQKMVGGGSNKKTRKFLKRKSKSKRVRFAV